MKRNCKSFLVLGFSIVWLFFGSQQLAAQNKTKIKKPIIDFGYIAEGTFQPIIFEVINTTTDTLFVEKVETVCGCMTAKNTPTLLLPLQSQKFEIIFDSREMIGLVQKQIRIFYRNIQVPDVAKFFGHVNPVQTPFSSVMRYQFGPILMRSDLIFGGHVAKNQKKAFVIKMTNPTDKDIHVNFNNLPKFVKSIKLKWRLPPFSETPIPIEFIGDYVPASKITSEKLYFFVKGEKPPTQYSLRIEVSQFN